MLPGKASGRVTTNPLRWGTLVNFLFSEEPVSFLHPNLGWFSRAM